MTFVVVTTSSLDAIPDDGTLLAAYPDGYVQGDFIGSEGHVLIINNNDEYTSAAGDFEISFGVSQATITNRSGHEWPADARYRLQFDTVEASETVISATRWTTARTITLAGGLTGEVSLDGSTNVTLEATVVDDSHNHVIGNVDGLEDALAGKAATSHTHAISAVTNLQTSLDAKAPLASPNLDQPIFTRARTLTASFDLDTLTASGFYVGSQPVNTPVVSTGNFWYINVYRHSGNDQYVVQEAFPMTGAAGQNPAANCWMRSRSLGTWQAWTCMSVVGHTHAISDITGLQADLDELSRGLSVTRAVAATLTVPSTVLSLTTTGYSAVGDGGGALHKRVASEPAHEGKFRSVDRFLPNGTTSAGNGGWWELDEPVLRPEMFGGAANSNGNTGNGTDNADAFEDMYACAKLIKAKVEFLIGTYRQTREISLVDSVYPFTIEGQGSWQTFLYGDFVGAGDYILDLSNSAGNSYSTYGHKVRGIGFRGNGVAGDPQGLGLENSFEHEIDDINAPNIGGKVLRNSVIVVTRDNNSKFNLVRSQGGWQPPAVSIPSDATASFTSGSPTITGNTAFFTPAMIGASIYFSKGSTSAANLVWAATITDVPTNPSSTCTISINAPTTQSGAVVGIGLISGTITSGSDQLTLTGGVGINSDYVGMQIHVVGASLKTDAGSTDGVLSTRIVSVSGSVLTLADDATVSVNGALVYFAPAGFLGSFEGEDSARQTNHSWWSNTHFEGFLCAGLIINRVIYAKFDRLKVHGRGFFSSNWVQCYTPIVMSEIKNIDLDHLQLAFGAQGRKMSIYGSRGVVNLDNVEIGHIYLNNPPILAQEVTDDFVLRPGLVTAVYGLDGFGPNFEMFSVPVPHNIEHGTVFTRNQRLQQRTRNTALYAPGATGQYAYVAIADDSVYSFKPPGNFGRLHVTSPHGTVDGEVQYRTSNYPSAGALATLLRDGGNIAVSTSVLTGTTGTDGKLTVAPDTSGLIRIENRRGFEVLLAFYVSPFGNVTA